MMQMKKHAQISTLQKGTEGFVKTVGRGEEKYHHATISRVALEIYAREEQEEHTLPIQKGV